MLFFIALGVLVAGITIVVLCDNGVFCSEALENTGLAFVVIGALSVFVAVMFLCNGHIGVHGKIAENQRRYESLTYQYENNMYDNDNEIGKKELMNQIQKWNEDLAWYKANQKDFWIGIFIPNVYDRFEFIELE